MSVSLVARRCLIAAALCASVGAGTLSASEPSLAFRQAVAEVTNETEAVLSFYEARDYAPLWTAPEATALRRAFFTALLQADAHGLPSGRYDAAQLMQAFQTLRSDRDLRLLEARMTQAYLQWARDISSGALEPGRVDSGIVREVMRPDPLSLLQGVAGPAPERFLRRLPPQSREYTALMKQKLWLEQRVLDAGWGPTVPADRTLRAGDTGPAVIALRDRLIAQGYIQRSASPGYDELLTNAVRAFQSDHGLAEDGVAGPATLSEINVSPEARLQSVIVAMERERWLGDDRGRRHIWVNLADFSTRIVDDGKITFETRSVIGRNTGHQRTPEFSDSMEYLVVNPSWTIPRSIIGREYLPALQQNRYALGHLQVVNSNGQVIDRGAVDFRQFSSRTFPFYMRQPPGPQNALGTVKFMFPNKYAIYLHDTPQKNLFGTDLRMYSNGCIRLNDPHEFAYALMARQEADPQAFFHRTLNTGRETRVQLKEPVPVHLDYRTAIATPQGTVQFRRDVYGRDGRIFDALVQAGVTLPGVQG